MGVPAWVWFVIAVVAAAAGVTLLLRDRARLTSRNRERRRWADLRGWQFSETDHVLPTKWRSGALGYYGLGTARDVVSGSIFTADGRRRVCVFDLDQNGRVSTVIAGLQLRHAYQVTVELWLPSVPFQREDMPELRLCPYSQDWPLSSTEDTGVPVT